MLLTELITKLGFQIDLEPLQVLDEKVSEAKKELHELGETGDKAGNKIKAGMEFARNALIGLTVVAAAAAGAVFEIAKSAAEAGDEINKTAPLLGLTVEEFQKYRYAAKLAGVENESFAQSTILLLRNSSEAQKGNKQTAESFAKIGLSLQQLKGLSTAELYRKVSDGLEKIPSKADRIALSMDLMGRSGARMGQFLARGNEEIDKLTGDIDQFGVFTEDSAQGAEDFNDALERVGAMVAGIKNEIGQGLFPIFQKMADSFREWLVVNRDLIRSGLQTFIRGTISVLTTAWHIARNTAQAVSFLVKAFGGLQNILHLLTIAAATLLVLKMGAAIQATVATIGLLATGLAGLNATSAYAFLAKLSAGFAQLSATMLIPALETIAWAAGIAVLILAFEDLTAWVRGGSSLIGEWLGPWEAVPDRFRAIWQEIKDAFKGGGEFIAAVLRGDFKTAMTLLQEGVGRPMTSAAGSASNTGGSAGVGGWGGMAPAYAYAMAGGSGGPKATSGPGLANFKSRFTMVSGADGQPELRPASAAVSQSNKVDIHVNVPKGTTQEQGEQIAQVVHEVLSKQVDHSLQQSVPPGR